MYASLHRGFALTTRVFFCAFLLCACLLAVRRTEAQATVSLPDTPVGKLLAGWLSAFNSGNRDTLREFIAANFAPPPNSTLPVEGITNRQFGMFMGSQGFVLRAVSAATADRISVVVETKRSGYWMQIGMGVTAEAPHRILGMSFRNIAAPAELLPHTKLSESEIRKRIDSLISKLVESDEFSGVILVAKDDKTIYARASGMANRACNIPNRIDTRFNIGSIGKMFTAVAIAQLVEQGKLSYTDTLAKVLPDYPNKELAEKVTVHHLLSHTSGITNPSTDSDDKLVATLRQRFRTVKEYLPTTPTDTLKFEPGAQLEYSNYGYMLLGAIIESVSGQDYYDYIREHIYKPAGMNHSDSYELDTDPPNLATGYMDAPGGMRRSNIFFMPIKGIPSGLGYATAEDMVRFANALRNHKLLSAASLATVWTGVRDYEPNGKYGYGCIVTQYNGTRIVGHGGGWFGITDKFDLYPDLGYTVVILNNIDSAPNPLAYKLREWLTQR